MNLLMRCHNQRIGVTMSSSTVREGENIRRSDDEMSTARKRRGEEDRAPRRYIIKRMWNGFRLHELLCGEAHVGRGAYVKQMLG